jgi:hypothetical protein
MTIDEIKRKAARAARKGDVQAMDNLELEYIKRAIRLTVESQEDAGERAQIIASPTHLFRGAGPNGETRVRWVRFDGVIVHSDINGHQVDQLDDTPTLFPLEEAA